MLLGIISDIHGNIQALEAMHEHLLSKGCSKIICAGDIVGYGANPMECVDFVRAHDIVSIRGNHDTYVNQDEDSLLIQPYARAAITWTKQVLDDERKAWLRDLPLILNWENMIFVHASLEVVDGDGWPYILDTKSAMFHFFSQSTQLAFFGHTHIPLVFTLDENRRISIELLKHKSVERGGRAKYLINPGSVGQPRDFDSRASALIFDMEAGSLKVARVQYDLKAAQKGIVDAGLPQILAERLSRGN